MRKIKVSFFTCVRNEAHNLAGLLENVKDVVDEIVVIDDASTDNLAEVVKKYGARLYRVKPTGYVEPNRRIAMSKVSYDWVLYLDADERINESLKRDLAYILSRQGDETAGIAISVRYYIDEKRFVKHYRDMYPNLRLRIVRKGKVLFKDTIHSDPVPLGKVIYLDHKKYFIRHLAFHHYDLTNTNKHIKYAKIAAVQRKRGNFIDAFLALISPILVPVRLLKDLIYKRALLDGLIGVKISLIHVMYLTLIDIFKALEA